MLKITTKQIDNQEVTITLQTYASAAIADKINPQEKSNLENLAEMALPILSTPRAYEKSLQDLGIDPDNVTDFQMFLMLVTLTDKYKKPIGSMLTINGHKFDDFVLMENNEDKQKLALVNLSHKEIDGKVEFLTESVYEFIRETVKEEYQISL